MLATFFATASVAGLWACGKAEPTAPPVIAVDTSTLAGTWKGSLNGSFGYSTTTFALRADSTLTITSELPAYCTMNGRWSVAADRFASTGSDCTSTTITLGAPMHNRLLSGTWTASSGRSGTFVVGKVVAAP